MSRLHAWLADLLCGTIRLYQYTLAGVFGGHCRFYPSCSEYTRGAIASHGALRGVGLGLRRLSRCSPLGGSGIDPVPIPRGERSGS